MKIIMLSCRVSGNSILRQDYEVEKETKLTFKCTNGDIIRKDEMYGLTDYKCLYRDGLNVFFTDESKLEYYENILVNKILEMAESELEKARTNLDNIITLGIGVDLKWQN